MQNSLILFFDPKNGHAKPNTSLFESRKGYGRWHNHFVDLENIHVESIILLFDPKNGHAK